MINKAIVKTKSYEINKMSDSTSFTSLMDLVESHLSKTSLQASNSGNGSHLSIPFPSSVQKGLSDTLLNPPNKILPLPRFEAKKSAITDVLAQQVTNMLIAKENRKKEEEEKKRQADEIKRILVQKQEDNYVIDLMPAVIRNSEQKPLPKQEAPILSNSSSFESLFTEVNKEIEMDKPIELKIEELPINTDMSYILFQKVKKGKCSAFGKVLSSRLRPVAAPYLRTEIKNPKIKIFDFSTKSPCDILKEKKLKPHSDIYSNMNMVTWFMTRTNSE